MDSFDLEDIKEKNEEENVIKTQKDKVTSIKKVPFIIGIIILVFAFLDMIILFAIPYHRIRTNKRKLPDALFKKPNVCVIVFHFILHVLVMLVGVFVILFGLKNYENVNHDKVKCGLLTVCILTGIFWVITICIDFSQTTNITTKTTIDQLISILNHNPPINFAFIFTKDEIEDYICNPDCEVTTITCYSKSGVSIPLKTQIISEVYNFTDTPEMFYFTIEQKLNMTVELKAFYQMILKNINNCDNNNNKVVEYYPLISGSYIVSKKKVPAYLNKGTRIVSILFGVGVYYELNSKSVPFINYVQISDADVVPGVNYNQIFTSEKCKNYGVCSQYNNKPKPN